MKLVLALAIAIVSTLLLARWVDLSDPADDDAGFASSELVEDDDDGGETADDIVPNELASVPQRPIAKARRFGGGLRRTDRTCAPDTPPPRG